MPDDQPTELDLVLAAALADASAELGAASELTVMAEPEAAAPEASEEEASPRRRRTRGGRRRTTKADAAEPVETQPAANRSLPMSIFSKPPNASKPRTEVAKVRARPARKPRAAALKPAPQPAPATASAPAPEAPALPEPAAAAPEPVAAEPTAQPALETAQAPAGPNVRAVVIGAEAPAAEKKRGWWRR